MPSIHDLPRVYLLYSDKRGYFQGRGYTLECFVERKLAKFWKDHLEKLNPKVHWKIVSAIPKEK